MKKREKKLTLEALKVNSFVTKVDETRKILGGATNFGPNCVESEEGSMCESIGDLGSDKSDTGVTCTPPATQTCFTQNPAECNSHHPDHCDSQVF